MGSTGVKREHGVDPSAGCPDLTSPSAARTAVGQFGKHGHDAPSAVVREEARAAGVVAQPAYANDLFVAEVPADALRAVVVLVSQT